MKQSAFEVIHQLLRREELSPFFATCLVVIEFMQIMYFAFSDINKPYWNSSSVGNALQSFFGFFLVYPNLTDDSSSLYIAVFYVVVCLIVLMFFLLFYVSLFAKYKLPFTSPVAIARYFVLFL